MTNIDIEVVRGIALKAGVAIIDIYNSGKFEMENKLSESDGFISPLTAADKASHNVITTELNRLYPDIPVVSEEQDMSINLEAIKQPQYWVIDPIDGTKGFVNRDGEFTINIGLIKDKVPVAGVVFAPIHDQMYFSDHSGARLATNSQAIPISASTSSQVKKVVASKNHMDDTTKKFLEQFGDIKIVQAGSSLKICKVASGEADLYPRLAPTTMEWDTAAADAILRAAGGKMINMYGGNLEYGKLPELRNNGFVAKAPNVDFILP